MKRTHEELIQHIKTVPLDWEKLQQRSIVGPKREAKVPSKPDLDPVTQEKRRKHDALVRHIQEVPLDWEKLRRASKI